MTPFHRIVVASLFVLWGAGSAQAGAGLLITPQRVVLEGRDREASITISNAGDEAGGYRIFFTNYQMSEQGAFEPVSAGTAGNFADVFIRFSPRQVVLAPGETQSIRLSVRRPADLAPGEYRSHLVFQGVPRKGGAQPLTSGKGKARAAITTLYGVSIPVIYRYRTSAPKLTIAGAELNRDEAAKPRLVVEVARSGDESVYGNVRVSYRAPGSKTFVPVGESNGNAVYVPLERRFIPVPLAAGELAKGGVLRVLFESEDRVLAGRDLPIE